MRLALVEPEGSPFRDRIARATAAAGLQVEFINKLEQLPNDAPMLGFGPSIQEPVAAARRIRTAGGQPLVVFFVSSAASHDLLQAELVRNPFAYSRYEVIQLDLTARQLHANLAGLATRATPPHGHRNAVRRPRRSRPAATRGVPTEYSDEHLASILAQAQDAIFSTDAHARLATWNRSAERMLGYTAEAVRGHPLELLDAPEAASTLISELGASVLRGGQPTEQEVAMKAADGHTVLARLSLAPVRDRNARLIGLSIIARDSSERMQVEEALRDANRQKDEFLAIMSHELRTPLTSILGYTDMLLRGLSGPLPPRASKYVGNVRTAGDRLLELVNGLLDYTRLEAGVERVELRPLELSELVDQVARPFFGQAEDKGITLRVQADPIEPVMGDREKLEHVLRSYLGNAIKFTPHGGCVTVTLQGDPDREGWVRISVSDSGIGLREEQITRVWERFYQGDASLTRAYGGMGLGLSIARHLVLLHGGAVGAESDGPGQGSTFWFAIPRRAAS